MLQTVELGRPRRHIGLVPFLPSPFNAARSYTKQFDIERAGALGVYVDCGPWVSRIKHADPYARVLPMKKKVVYHYPKDSTIHSADSTGPPVHIIKPHNIILAQVTPRLHFDHLQVNLAWILKTVLSA